MVVGLARDIGRSGRTPKGSTDRGNGVAEGRLGLPIPSGGQGTKGCAGGDEAVGPDRDEREEAEKRWRGPRDREVGPLPLRLDAEMSSCLLEGRFHRPALLERSEDLRRLALAGSRGDGR